MKILFIIVFAVLGLFAFELPENSELHSEKISQRVTSSSYQISMIDSVTCRTSTGDPSEIIAIVSFKELGSGLLVKNVSGCYDDICDIDVSDLDGDYEVTFLTDKSNYYTTIIMDIAGY